jgi:SpoVK/Ycf46/Vps4 family AAA+-type ATPase
MDLKYFNEIYKKPDFKNTELYDSDDEIDISVCLSDLKCDNTQSKTESDKKIITIQDMINKENITDINDLITLGNYYEKNLINKKEKEITKDNLYKYGEYYYTINLEKICNIKGPLIKLKKMIGLTKIKNEIIDMLLYYLTNYEIENNNMLHMTLEGKAGCGKTKLAKIITKIMSKMGILESDKIIFAKSIDLIGEYVGQTGPKTQNVINKALGGVLFIDEAYALGSSKGLEHNFSLECINVLNQNLSDNKNKFICIIAGYPNELNEMFFSANSGLERRFPFRFTIEGYTEDELLQIFINKIHKLKWKINKDVDLKTFFKLNYKKFKYYGGDIDTFIQNIKYSYSRRNIGLKYKKNVVINNNDINNAFEKFNETRKNKKNKKNKNVIKKIKKIFT